MAMVTVHIDAKRAKILAPLLTPRLNKYIPHVPTIPQIEFLLTPQREVLFGGAAGGGKSDSLLMAALQYCDVPGYSAIVFRRTYQDLALAGGLIPRSMEWLGSTDARWDGVHKMWKFPSGAILSFGYMDTDLDKFRYQGAEYQFIGWDELTQMTEAKYTFMFSRHRKLTASNVPLRVRSASNPGGVGHQWVKDRFVDERTKIADAVFIPARVDDNPHINREAYIESLGYLDPVTKARYLEGDWTISEGGRKFRREDFEDVVDTLPPIRKIVRAWDLAATDKKYSKRTAGVLLGWGQDGYFYVVDVVKGKWVPGDRDERIRSVAAMDSKQVPIVIEQEPGSGGKAQIHAIIRSLPGWKVDGIPATGDKVTRADGVASQANIKRVRLLRGNWNSEFVGELEAFPEGQYLDQVDALALAFNILISGANPVDFGRKVKMPKSYRDELSEMTGQHRDRSWRDDMPI